MSSLSVIIPTHKRARILKECLRRLEQQTIASGLEVIVVSDGHDQQTAELFAGIDNGKWTMNVRFIEIEKSQQGVARNRGVREATSDTILFIGDDIFLEPTACEAHLKAHAKLSIVHCPLSIVLGHITWDPACGITPVMQWLERTGWQFGFPKIERYRGDIMPKNIQHLFTYTSNLSIPTNVANAIPFREDVRLYGWEDIEWGKRLADAGVRLFYEPNARALHHHHIELEDSLKRMETLGMSIVGLTKVAPRLDRLPRGWKRMVYELTPWLPTMGGRHRKAFLMGIKNQELRIRNDERQE